MALNPTVLQRTHVDFTPRITLIGVGGGGTNAVDNMIVANLQGVDFVVASTDEQQLLHTRADRQIRLGPHITQGLGARAKPEIGRAAAEEVADQLIRHLEGVHMLFITAGMGGGIGTGAAPVIARLAKERGILTVAVVTRPFDFEGKRRRRAAEVRIEELQHHVNTLIVIPNQNLFRMVTERTTWREAFKMADQILYMGVRVVTDLLMAPGMVNLDFDDIRSVMAAMGKAMMGAGEADGENRAIRAAEAAISNPLLDDTSMSSARELLINITGGNDMTLYEVDQAANRLLEEVEEEAEINFGSTIDDSLTGKVRVSFIAGRFASESAALLKRRRSGRNTRRQRTRREWEVAQADVLRALDLLKHLSPGIGHNSISAALTDPMLPIRVRSELENAAVELRQKPYQSEHIRQSRNQLECLSTQIETSLPADAKQEARALEAALRRIGVLAIEEFAKSYSKRLGDLAAYATWGVIATALLAGSGILGRLLALL